MLAVLVLLLWAVIVPWVLPRLMAERPSWRRAPRAALVVWQAVSLSGVVAALALTPAVIGLTGSREPALFAAACLVSGFIAVRLLLSGHQVGRRLRSARARNREIVDLIGSRDDRLGERGRVLAHPSPSAYCVPGRRSRMVLTEGAIESLTRPELLGVLAHERSHLRARHDLVLEFFTVLHESVPVRLRCQEALAEVRLLVEVLADRAAVAEVGPVPVGRALLRLASPTAPEGALAASDLSATARVELLDARAAGWMAPVMYLFGAVVLLAPVVAVVSAFAAAK